MRILFFDVLMDIPDYSERFAFPEKYISEGMVILTPVGRDLTLFSSFLQGIIQASLSYALAASVGFALLGIAQASLALLLLIAKIRICFVYVSYILRRRYGYPMKRVTRKMVMVYKKTQIM